MIRSMTGFGQAIRTFSGYSVQMDLKSVNHRHCEVVVRMPREFLKYEEILKRSVQQYVKRGRVDLYVAIERSSESARTVELNWPLADAYRSAAEKLAEKFGLAAELSIQDYLNIPDLIAFKETVQASEEEIRVQMSACAEEAVLALVSMRETEGAFLSADMTERLESMQTYLDQARILAPVVVLDYADKLRLRIRELVNQPVVDESRLTTEIAVFAERSNVDEEVTRLQSHISQCRQLLKSIEPIGRKFDFLLQEMNREVNTIGSKANHSELTTIVVEMKAELEKMREQIQNIE